MTKTGANPPAHKLTSNETDENYPAAATPEDGAIEDCEKANNAVKYFFESGPRAWSSSFSAC
jgi:hypothetical protein